MADFSDINKAYVFRRMIEFLTARYIPFEEKEFREFYDDLENFLKYRRHKGMTKETRREIKIRLKELKRERELHG